MFDLICINEDGFEDQLTKDKPYVVQKFGANSYLINNDKGEPTWYGRSHFVMQAV